MFNFKKLLVASLAAMALLFSASICALGAQIDSLSIVDDMLYASVDAENSRIYVAEYSEGLLSDVFFKDVPENGQVELSVNGDAEYVVYVWDKDSLAPVCSFYKIIDGRAYMDNSDTPVPEYSFSDYTFNQEDNVFIVSSITSETITGFKAGEETNYNLTDNVTVLGLSDKFDDITPGSVVLIGTNAIGDCAAIELLASIGTADEPVDLNTFESGFGVHAASDGSTKYQNIVTEMYSKNGSKLTTFKFDENGEKIYEVVDGEKKAVTETYTFQQDRNMCYRVGIALDIESNVPIISCTGNKISTYPSIFENTSKYHNYLYLRYNTETGKLVECVYYCVPKDFNPGAGGEGWTDIFSLEPIVIIK